MLQSRKIVSVKTLQDSSGIYIRGMIKKSYGTTVTPAVKYFQGNMPCKATCSCPVGLSRVCCHILAFLFYLKHYSDTKEKNIRVNMHTTPLKMASQIKEGFHPNGAIKRNRAKISKYEKKQKKN